MRYEKKVQINCLRKLEKQLENNKKTRILSEFKQKHNAEAWIFWLKNQEYDLLRKSIA